MLEGPDWQLTERALHAHCGLIPWFATSVLEGAVISPTPGEQCTQHQQPKGSRAEPQDWRMCQLGAQPLPIPPSPLHPQAENLLFSPVSPPPTLS